MRRELFAPGEYYHIYNRGVDKRNIFDNKKDLNRFFQSMKEFNTIKPIGSIYENSFKKEETKKNDKKLVEFVAYCLNPNHYHFLLKQVSDRGIEKFLHKLSLGYTNYYNLKNKREGPLFSGRYKSVHIKNDGKLFYLNAYINLNFRVHKIYGESLKLVKSSWSEYIGENNENFCNKDVLFDEDEEISEYKERTVNTLETIISNREENKDIQELFME